MIDNDLFLRPIDQLYRDLASSEQGLTGEAATALLKLQRPARRPDSFLLTQLKLLILQFINPLVLLLIIAALLSLLLGEYSDSIILLVILLVTGLLGYWQEMKAARVVDQLRKMIEMRYTVLRNGIEVSLPVDQIVPGDVLVLDAGDMIPADSRIIQCNELHVNESALTGESYPAEKSVTDEIAGKTLLSKSNCLWQGTSVISGTATALVLLTGEKTMFGQISKSLSHTPETAFEKGIRRFGYFLLRITLTLSVIILAASLYFHKPFFDAIMFALALAVGMAPELLPAIMTFAMAAGAKKLARKKVVIKKLSSIFNFGEVSILCTDKTGTITEADIIVKDIVDGEGHSCEKAKRFAYLNATLQKGFVNPLDKALSTLKVDTNGFEGVDEIPYDFIRKRLSIVVKNAHASLLITKGAFANILDVCTQIESIAGTTGLLTAEGRATLNNRFVDWSRDGYRVLGLAYKPVSGSIVKREDECEMIFLGFILLEDPLKDTARESIEKLRHLNVDVKIITGDNRYAAMHAAKQLGIGQPVIITGEELRNMSAESLRVKVRSAELFAEIEPQQKEIIVRALQQSGLPVGFIGDGINDVAAINVADIGISTNNAVDVAKDAADFVMLEKDLDVLADGIAEGRKCFANSMKYIYITTSATFGNMFSVAGASLLLPFLPMLPKQLLLTNLVTDFPFLAIAADKVDADQLTKPGKWNLRAMRKFMLLFGFHSSLFDFITFAVLYYYFSLRGAAFQTMWFLESIMTEILILFIIRSKRSFLKSRPGKMLCITAIISMLVTILLPFSAYAVPLGLVQVPFNQLIALLAILVAYVLTADLLKLAFFKKTS